MTGTFKDLTAEISREETFSILEKQVAWKTIHRHRARFPRYTIDSFCSACNFLARILDASPVELLYVIGLDSSNRFLGCTKLASGTVDRAAVYPRLLVSFLLSVNASAVIVAHNHPGGKMEFSREDISLTKRLTEILQPLDIRLLDHILYVPEDADVPGQWMSMTKEGMI